MPPPSPQPQLTELLRAWNQGDAAALDRLVQAVYPQLHQLARQRMARERGLTLQATALVNEAYLRLVDMKRVEWADRTHFFAVAARVMRHVLVDMARARHRQKRGGDVTRVSLGDVAARVPARAYDVLGLDRALDELASLDARRGRVVELRVFAGMTIEETAVALGVSGDTVTRDWKLAKAWLSRRLGRPERAVDKA